MADLYRAGATQTRLYYGTDTHAQSILVGCALATVLTMVKLRRGTDALVPVARSTSSRWTLSAGRDRRRPGVGMAVDPYGQLHSVRLRGGLPRRGAADGPRSGLGGLRPRRPAGRGAVGPGADLPGHHLLRHVPVVLPDLPVRGRGPDRPDRAPSVRRPRRHRRRHRHAVVLPGGAAGPPKGPLPVRQPPVGAAGAYPRHCLPCPSSPPSAWWWVRRPDRRSPSASRWLQASVSPSAAWRPRRHQAADHR